MGDFTPRIFGIFRLLKKNQALIRALISKSGAAPESGQPVVEAIVTA
jgi:hypothetical protein